MKRAEIEHKFDEIVAFAEIEKFMDTPVKHYSSGMYVRLALWNRPLLQSLRLRRAQSRRSVEPLEYDVFHRAGL